MEPEVGWVLNLDAEDELAHRGHHTPSDATTARIGKVIPWLRESGLLRDFDSIVWPAGDPGTAQVGRAWMPTRWALAQLERAGLAVPKAPSMEVLAKVNHRAFSAALGQRLPGARFVTSVRELDETFAASAGVENWLLKRAFGYAGRGRKRLRPAVARTAEELAWVEASFPSGLQVEPLVRRTADFGLHGFISSEGSVTRGVPTLQVVDDSGAWRSTRRAEAGELSSGEFTQLAGALDEAARALIAAGYFGPFGIDAFRWVDGSEHFQPRSEINARYSMGWAVGMRPA